MMSEFPPIMDATGEPEKVTVRWYSAEKGYGFVVDKDGNDVFIHVTVVKASGRTTLIGGDELIVRRGPSRKSGRDSVNLIVN
jgi:cold shock CspA family protein